MTNVDLAKKAGVSKRSLIRIESGDTVRPEILRRVEAVFKEDTIEFIAETNTEEPSICLRKKLDKKTKWIQIDG